jgi:rare lipoprotein A
MLTRTLLLTLLALALPAASAAAQSPSTGGAAAPTPGALSLAPPSLPSGQPAELHGTGPAGRDVTVERFDPAAKAWVAAAGATARADGTFTAAWRPALPGRVRMRVVAGEGAQASSLSPELTVTVYRRALATFFGPGLYGRRTACGQRLTARLEGVAHKTLPCGTQVAVRYGTTEIVVPVVDRGPFRRGTSFDLTAATATALGFGGTDYIGAVSVAKPAPRPARGPQPSR